MIIGAGKVIVEIPGCRSLKEKRMTIRSVMDRARSKFRIAIGEVGQNDVHHLAEIGFTCVGNDPKFVKQVVDKVLDFLNGAGDYVVIDEQALIDYFENESD